MQLRPLIASIHGPSASAMRAALDERALELVARIARGPAPVRDIDPAALADLVQMRALREQDGLAWLDTAVFCEEDIRRANRLALDFGAALAEKIMPAAETLRGLHPAVLNFLVGIVAVGQILHHAMKASGHAVDWFQYAGKYTSTKVDFEEVCEEARRLEPDLHTKGVEKGRRYTAVLIGPGGSGYFLKPGDAAAATTRAYIWALDRYLTDAFPLLLTGQLDHPALREAAEAVGLFRDGQPEPLVITIPILQPCIPALDAIGQITRAVYYEQLDAIHALLAATPSGSQGVPDNVMTMHLWRYMRRGIVRSLYACGLFTDRAPEKGLITVFYENDVEYLTRLLG